MKLEKGLRIISSIIILLGFICTPASAQNPGPDSTDSSVFSGETVTYDTVPLNESAKPGLLAESADILLIQTNDPWERSSHYIGSNWYDGVTSDTMVLDTLGYTYRVATWNDINGGQVNIFSYPVVLIVNDQVQSFYDSYAAHVADFENYVSNGHTLLFFAAGFGWAQGQLKAPLPGGVRWNGFKSDGYSYRYASRNVITNSGHPVVTAELSNKVPLTGADLYSNYCSHGTFTNLLPQTNIVMREALTEGDGPTFIDYKYGAGRVVATTLTWEHNWSYHTGLDYYGTFARKSLDDIFLYALSGGSIPSDVSVDLRIEDAPGYTTVSKSRGSTIDVVARVKGSADYPFTITLTVPSDRFGNPETTFTRNHPGDSVMGQQDQFTEPVSGQYRVSGTLAQRKTGGYYKEVVWRFRIPTTASAEKDIALSSLITIPNYTVQTPLKTVRFEIIDYARSLIITNRQLLFNKYGSDPNDNQVSLLLEHIYSQAYVYNAEVFYVDRYSANARNWDQNVTLTSEATANGLANEIDGLLEGWYNRLTKKVNLLVTMRPEFLLIVGGDEIIPFYRVDDRLYGDEEFKYNVFVDNTDPVGKLPQNHFFLSDNNYADVGGGKSDWEKGNLELSYGRIIGHSAKAMYDFMHNAWFSTPDLTNAVLASRSGSHNLTEARNKLNSRNVAIYGEKDPDLTENDDWTMAQFRTALEQNYQVLGYQGHGNYDGWYGTDDWAGGITTANHPGGSINTNHPLFAVEACDFAIPSDLDGTAWKPEANDNISYKLIDLGAGGVLGSTAIDTTAGLFIIGYGELLHNNFFKYLIPSSATYSEYYGTALLKAKQNYGTILGIYTGTDKKALLEYVYYGLPWSVVKFPAPQAAPALVPEQNGFKITEKVKETALADFTRSITLDVSSYNFTPVDQFELLEIPGLEYIYKKGEPILPLYRTTISLPPGAMVNNLAMASETPVALGEHPIPAADPLNSQNNSTGFTSQMSVTGLYPPARYAYNVKTYPDRVDVEVTIAPATFVVETHQLTLYSSTTVQVSYSTPILGMINSVDVEKPEYTPGESVAINAQIGNLGAVDLPLTARVEVFDSQGQLKNWVESAAFVVPGGSTYPLQLQVGAPQEPGNYRTAVTIYENGTAMHGSSVSFVVLAGKISAFTGPAKLTLGEYGKFTITYENYRSTQVAAYARVIIYNSAGVEVSSLLQRSFSIDANSSASTSWDWNWLGLPEGNYSLQPVVNIGSEWYSGALLPVQFYSEKMYMPSIGR